MIKKCPIGRNPAYPGPSQTLKMFASSVSFGYPETLIKPDEQVDFKTMNQAYSYVGFELLEGRRLVPQCYTIRNCIGDSRKGDSKSECGVTLLNWQFEASLDMLSWEILDKRVHYPNLKIMKGPPSKIVQSLTPKGAISTWGIDQKKCSAKFGYKYFRIVQIGTNYEGGYNMGLSALEIYGLSNEASNWEQRN